MTEQSAPQFRYPNMTKQSLRSHRSSMDWRPEVWIALIKSITCESLDKSAPRLPGRQQYGVGKSLKQSRGILAT